MHTSEWPLGEKQLVFDLTSLATSPKTKNIVNKRTLAGVLASGKICRFYEWDWDKMTVKLISVDGSSSDSFDAGDEKLVTYIDNWFREIRARHEKDPKPTP
jgi:hypothetical protein